MLVLDTALANRLREKGAHSEGFKITGAPILVALLVLLILKTSPHTQHFYHLLQNRHKHTNVRAQPLSYCCKLSEQATEVHVLATSAQPRF